MKPLLGLGTAQFGLEYGIAGGAKVSPNEAGQMIAVAALNGVKVIDTASQYGNALEVLSKHKRIMARKSMRIILKIPHIPEKITFDVIANVRDQIFADLNRLGVSHVDTLMVHNPQAFIGPGSELVYDLLLNFKYAGYCDKIGVSVYTPAEFFDILQLYPVDVVSIPNSYIDQSFNQHLDVIRAFGVEIHTRSIFLQGALVMPLHDVHHLGWQFRTSRRKVLRGFEGDALAGALDYLKKQDAVHHGIIGANSYNELEETIIKYHEPPTEFRFRGLQIRNQKVIDPREWKNGSSS